MAAPGLREPAKKALATLDREWAGLIAHREYPMIGLDNNNAERAIRGPVVTRKNARGSHNDDSARLAATVWTVTATAQMAGLNVLTYLTAYLDACGRNNGKPLSGPRLERFLPWNADPEHLRTWRNGLAGHHDLDDGRPARVRQGTLHGISQLPVRADLPPLAAEDLSQPAVVPRVQ